MDDMLKRLRKEKNTVKKGLEENQSIEDVLCYGKITVSKNDTDKSNQKDLYLYLIKKQINGQEVMELTTNGKKFATINKDSKENIIIIEKEFQLLINEKELLLQVRDVSPTSLNKLEELEKQKRKLAKKEKQEAQDEKEESKEKEQYIAQIDINKEIIPGKTIRGLVPEIKEKGIKEVFVKRKDTTRMEFVGIDENNEEIKIESISQVQGTNPNKDVVEVNEDGSKVSKNKVLSMMQIKNGTNEKNSNEGFTVDIGEYGVPEVNYYRRSPETNEYTSIPVNLKNTNQKNTDLDVKQYLDKTKNSTVDDNIKRANEELGDKDETVLENIDDDLYNNKDDTQILIQKAIARCKVSKKAFMIEFEKASGKTIEEKILNTEETLNEQYIGGKSL